MHDSAILTNQYTGVATV